MNKPHTEAATTIVAFVVNSQIKISYFENYFVALFVYVLNLQCWLNNF